MLSECRDAIQVVREELKPDQKQRDYILEGEPGKVSNLQYLHSYLTYIKLSMAIKRNESMAKGLHRALLQQHPEDDSKCSPRPQDLIRLYDIILQNLVELLQLPGLEEDKVFQKEIGLKILVFKAYRCFFIAQSYALVKKWSEALVLHDSILKYADEVNSDAGTFKNSLKGLPDVQELITQVWSEKCSLQAAAILDANDTHQTETSSSQVKDNKPLVERFETFCLDPSLVTRQANLVHFPPGFQPVPCKPLSFDLALSHVAFPPLEDKLEQKTKSGLTGYIKGIFGFRS
ncbi:SRP68 isoform 1 [Pongo abelii]|nr:SRP68 isoform 1 [Pongo abelii]